MAATELPAAPGKTNSDSTSDDPALALLTDLAGAVDAIGTIINNLTHLHGTDGTVASARTNLGLKAQAVDDGAAIQKQTYTYWEDTGTTNNLVITPVPAISAYAPGMKFSIKVKFAISGAAVIDINSLGDIAIKMPSGENPVAGQILSNQLIEGVIFYTGSAYQFVVVGGVITQPETQAMEVIETAEISSDASVEFTTGLDLYSHYELRFSNIVVTGAGTILGLQTSNDGGSSYAGGSSYFTERLESHAGASVYYSGTASTMTISGPLSNTAATSATGKIEFGDLTDASLHKLFTHQSAYFKNGGAQASCFGSGRRTSTAAIDGIRLIVTAGVMTSGRATLYGLNYE